MHRLVRWTVAAVVLAGCQVVVVDPRGKACDDAHPCPEGYGCYGGVCGAPCSDERLGTTCSVGVGACAASGTWLCAEGTLVCSATAGTPHAETCDGTDEDCNGTTDDVPGGCACIRGEQRPCGSNVGACHTGTQTCDGTGAFGACVDQVTPQAETCDGVDNDCNGIVDDVAGCVATAAGTSPPGFVDGALMAARFDSPTRLGVAANGDLLVADTQNHVIRRVSLTGGTVTLEAGVPGRCGYADGPAGIGKLCAPMGVVASPSGAVYIADSENDRIRKLEGGVLSTVAGSDWGFADGPAASAQFHRPTDLALYGDVLIVVDYDNCRIRGVTLTPPIAVTTLAGRDCDGTSVDGAATTVATLGRPEGLAVADDGAAFFTDHYGSKIRVLAGGQVTTLAGGSDNYVDGLGAAARFDDPTALALSPNTASPTGLYIADTDNNRLRFMSLPDCAVSTVAGLGQTGIRDGALSQALLAEPRGVAIAGGVLYFVSSGDHRLRKLDPASGIVTVAGGTAFSLADGPLGTGTLLWPHGIDYDPVSQIAYVADSGNHAIRALHPDGRLTTVSGGTRGFNDGALAVAQFNRPFGVRVTGDGRLIVADSGNNRLRVIDLSAGRVSTLAGTGDCDYLDGPAALAQLCFPTDVALGPAGAVYFADSETDTLRVVSGGVVAKVSGEPWAWAWVDGDRDTSRFAWPAGLAMGPDGMLYVADADNSVIRRVDPATGVSVTVAGARNCEEVDGPVSSARVCWPTGVRFDGNDLLVVSNSGGRLRRLVNAIETPVPTGLFGTVAGERWGYGFHDGPLLEALFDEPWAVSPAPGGGFYVADYRNNRIRRVMP